MDFKELVEFLDANCIFHAVERLGVLCFFTDIAFCLLSVLWCGGWGVTRSCK